MVDESGAIEQHIDGANLLGGIGDGLSVENIKHSGLNAGKLIEVGEFACVEVGGDHPSPLGCIGLDRGASYALRRCGDQSRLAG